MLGRVIFDGAWWVWTPLLVESFVLVTIVSYLALSKLSRTELTLGEHKIVDWWLGFIGRTASSFGLAGTLVGLSYGFAGFTSVPKPERVLGAMATAAYTTLAGIFLALVAKELLRLRGGREEHLQDKDCTDEYLEGHVSEGVARWVLDSLLPGRLTGDEGHVSAEEAHDE